MCFSRSHLALFAVSKHCKLLPLPPPNSQLLLVSSWRGWVRRQGDLIIDVRRRTQSAGRLFFRLTEQEGSILGLRGILGSPSSAHLLFPLSRRWFLLFGFLHRLLGPSCSTTGCRLLSHRVSHGSTLYDFTLSPLPPFLLTINKLHSIGYAWLPRLCIVLARLVLWVTPCSLGIGFFAWCSRVNFQETRFQSHDMQTKSLVAYQTKSLVTYQTKSLVACYDESRHKVTGYILDAALANVWASI